MRKHRRGEPLPSSRDNGSDALSEHTSGNHVSVYWSSRVRNMFIEHGVGIASTLERMMRRRHSLLGLVSRLLLLVVVVVGVASRPAQGCSYIPTLRSRTILPAAGTTDFPTDGALRVLLRGLWPEGLRELAETHYRLRDSSGELVPLRITRDGAMISLQPRAPLRPNTQYVLEYAFVYRDGRLLSDDQLASAVSGRRNRRDVIEGMERRWFPQHAFETGTGPEQRALTPPEILNAQYSTGSGGGGCGPESHIRVHLRLSEAFKATDVLSLKVRFQGEHGHSRHVPVPGVSVQRDLHISDSSCGSDRVHLRTVRPPVVQVRVLTASGSVITSESQVTTLRKGSTPLPKGYMRKSRSDLKQREERLRPFVERIAAISFAEAPMPPAPAPQSCPHGLTPHLRWSQRPSDATQD